MKKQVVIFCFTCLLLTLSGMSSHAETVNVGGYIFPPFVEQSGEQQAGLTLELINALNDFQDKYQFTFISTSSKRRYRDFDDGIFDMIFFESMQWGWDDKKEITATKVFLKGGEVYITKASPDKDQKYFNNLKDKSIACCLGYHYGFADFNADEKYLHDHFSVELSSTHEGNILKVLRDRTDIAVITKSFLDIYLKQHPEINDQMLISSRLDQIYQHTILLRKNSTPSVEEMNTLLIDMEKAGVLDQIWNKFGIETFK